MTHGHACHECAFAGKTGSKHHLIRDGGGNRSDVTQLLLSLVEAIRPYAAGSGGPAGDFGRRPRLRRRLPRSSARPRRLRADQPRGTRDNKLVPCFVEQALALLHRFRRLATRWERRTDIHRGFLDLVNSRISWRRLRTRMR